MEDEAEVEVEEDAVDRLARLMDVDDGASGDAGRFDMVQRRRVG